MTEGCKKTIENLEKTNQVFNSLSVEQLLYSAIKGTSIEDVEYVLDNTNWKDYIEEAN